MITSTNNPSVKQLIKLRKKRGRDQSARFLIDDIKALENSVRSGYEIENIFYSLEDNELSGLKNFEAALVRVSETVFARISYGERDKGIVALLKTKDTVNPDDLKIRENALFIVLENIEKPGNFGAILRTADAFKADAVVLTENSCDLYNPNVIRASRGTCFSLPVVSSDNNALYSYFQENKIKIFTLDPGAVKDFRHIEKKGPRALVFGSEHQGLTEFWKNKGEMLNIPMQGVGDSLNLSVAVALVTAEALRE